MTWWTEEIQQLRQENEQLRQQLVNQLSYCQLIEQYLKESKLTQGGDRNNLTNAHLELLHFKKWVEEKVTRNVH
ncbi:MAG TPA: hypothetical protein V6C85_35155 [Allocoleopsis sp.]